MRRLAGPELIAAPGTGCEFGTEVVPLSADRAREVRHVGYEHDIEFEHTSEATGGVSIVVHGEIDATTAPELYETIDRAVEGGARLVLVKLDHVNFIDSSGLRSLVAAADMLHGLDGQLFVDGASAAVSRVLEITGLIERLRAPTSDI